MAIFSNLSQIRTLQVCSRVKSFTIAAESLNCSQSAISQQVRNIEERLGFLVFKRTSKGIQVTPSGQRFLEVVSYSWGNIEAAADAERHKSNQPIVRIHAPAGFASCWLMPRIPNFYKQHPNLQVEIDTFHSEVQPMNINANVKISYGIASGQPAMQETIMPVFSPEFARKHQISQDISITDLRKKMLQLPLITELNYPSIPTEDSLYYWARSFQVNLHNRAFRKHSQSNIVLMDVEFGLGITIGRSCITMDSLASGKLIGLQKYKLTSPCSYYISSTDKAKCTIAFLDWFYEETQTTLLQIKA
ncbi:MAG: LysR family transcriptional regulator [Rhizobiales bacterium]|nr:LysR family transcriptional regulator [Hyphomicrobiales bacterium]